MEKAGVVFLMTMVGVVLAAIYGWVANIVKFIGMLDGDVTAMFIARIVGIFLAPFGSILGYF